VRGLEGIALFAVVELVLANALWKLSSDSDLMSTSGGWCSPLCGGGGGGGCCCFLRRSRSEIS